MNAGESLPRPAYGLGAAGLGNLFKAITQSEAAATLEAARSVPWDLIDTAPHYGHGLSEQRIGAFLASSGWRPKLSTKVGRRLRPVGDGAIPDFGFVSPAPFAPEFDYTGSGIRAAFAGSRQRLGVETVDTLLLHDIGEMVHGAAHGKTLTQALNEALPEMAAMKAEGKTGRVGLGVNEVRVCQEVLERVHLDVVLLAGRYTLLEHEASLSFLNECNRSGVRVIIGGAFNSGLLASPAGETLNYDYAKAPAWAVDRTRALRDVCGQYDVPLPAAALQFCRAHPAVESVLPGAQTPAQVRQIAAWAQHDIPAELWAELKTRGLVSRDAPVPA